MKTAVVHCVPEQYCLIEYQKNPVPAICPDTDLEAYYSPIFQTGFV